MPNEEWDEHDVNFTPGTSKYVEPEIIGTTMQTDHDHIWMVEQQTNHTYCHLCGNHKNGEPCSPFVRRALANQLPAKDLTKYDRDPDDGRDMATPERDGFSYYEEY